MFRVRAVVSLAAVALAAAVVGVVAAPLPASGAASGFALAAGFTAPVILEPAATSFDQEPWHEQVIAGANGDAAVVYAKDSALESSIWDSPRQAWGPAQDVATDGAFSADSIGSEPSASVAPDGGAVLAWPADPHTSSSRIDVASMTLGSSTGWSAPVTISSAGQTVAEPATAAGDGGTAAVAWMDDTGVEVAVRGSDGTWSAPTRVSPDIATDRVPAFDQPAVVISTAGEVTATWWAFDPTDGAGAYRQQASTRGGDGLWSTPTWLSDSGVAAVATPGSPAALAAGTDGSITASWDGFVAVRSDATGWSGPTPLQYSDGSDASLAPGPGGIIVAAWKGRYLDGLSRDHDVIMAREYTPASGWSTPALAWNVLTQYSTLNAATVSVDSSYHVWLTSLHSTASTGQQVLVRQRGYTSGLDTWSAPEQLTGETQVSDYSVAYDSAGYSVLALNVADPDGAQSTHGVYTLDADAAAWPDETYSTAPQIWGTAAAGQTLQLFPGDWNTTTSSIDITWQRRGDSQVVTGDTYHVTDADAGQYLDVHLIAHAPFRHDASWTQAVKIAQLPTSIRTGGPASIAYGSTASVTAAVTAPYGAVTSSGLSARLYIRPSSGGSWRLVATVPLSTSTVRSRLSARVNSQYQWRFSGSVALAASDSAVRTLAVTPVVTAHATHTRVHPQHTDSLWGAVSPTSSGEHVSVQRWYSGAWHTVGHATLRWQLLPNRTHAVGYTWTFSERWDGTYRFRVAHYAVDGRSSGYSPTVTVTVR